MTRQNTARSRSFGEIRTRRMTSCHLCRARRHCSYVSLDWREGKGDWTAYNTWLCDECGRGLRFDGVVVVDWCQLQLDTAEQLRRLEPGWEP